MTLVCPGCAEIRDDNDIYCVCGTRLIPYIRRKATIRLQPPNKAAEESQPTETK